MKIAMMLQTWIVLGYILRCTESLKTHEQLNTGINTKAFAANADANDYKERQDGYKVHQMATEGIDNDPWPVGAASQNTNGKCDFGDLWYGRFIDGKDVKRGKHAYGHQFVDRMKEAWHILAAHGEEKVDKHLFEKVHFKEYPTGLRDHSTVMFELFSGCMDFMSQELKKDILEDLPLDIIKIEKYHK